MSRYKALGLEDVMPFGKHKGAKIRVLLFDDIGYLAWCLSNTGLQLDPKADEMFQEMYVEEEPGDDTYWGGK